MSSCALPPAFTTGSPPCPPWSACPRAHGRQAPPRIYTGPRRAPATKGVGGDPDSTPRDTVSPPARTAGTARVSDSGGSR